VEVDQIIIADIVWVGRGLINIFDVYYLLALTGGMYWISALARAGPVSGHLWQIRQNLANIFAGFLDLVDISTATVHTVCLQLEVTSLE